MFDFHRFEDADSLSSNPTTPHQHQQHQYHPKSNSSTNSTAKLDKREPTGHSSARNEGIPTIFSSGTIENDGIASDARQQRNGGGCENGTRFRRIAASPGLLATAASASRLQSGRRHSLQTFQAHLASGKSFSNVLRGVELEDPRPDATHLEPQLELPWPFLLRLKVNTFAISLGLSSQAQLWVILSNNALVRSAVGGGGGIPGNMQWVFWIVAIVFLAVTSLAYAAKAALYWGAVKREWAHPIRSSFFFAPLLAAMTLMLGQPYGMRDAIQKTEVPVVVFMLLSILLLLLEMVAYGKWLFNVTSSLSRANPTYQLAVVGNFLLSVMGTRVKGSDRVMSMCGEISLFFFSVGILYYLLVFFAIQQNSAGSVLHPTSGISTGGSGGNNGNGGHSPPSRPAVASTWAHNQQRRIAQRHLQGPNDGFKNAVSAVEACPLQLRNKVMGAVATAFDNGVVESGGRQAIRDGSRNDGDSSSRTRAAADSKRRHKVPAAIVSGWGRKSKDGQSSVILSEKLLDRGCCSGSNDENSNAYRLEPWFETVKEEEMGDENEEGSLRSETSRGEDPPGRWGGEQRHGGDGGRDGGGGEGEGNGRPVIDGEIEEGASRRLANGKSFGELAGSTQSPGKAPQGWGRNNASEVREPRTDSAQRQGHNFHPRGSSVSTDDHNGDGGGGGGAGTTILGGIGINTKDHPAQHNWTGATEEGVRDIADGGCTDAVAPSVNYRAQWVVDGGSWRPAGAQPASPTILDRVSSYGKESITSIEGHPPKDSIPLHADSSWELWAGESPLDNASGWNNIPGGGGEDVIDGPQEIFPSGENGGTGDNAGSSSASNRNQGDVLSTALHPIYFLFIAPPSAASIAWAAVSGRFGLLARGLYFVAAWLYMFFVVGNWNFLRTASFSVAWWAYSFPSSTFAVATIMYAEELSSEGVALGALVFALASTTIVVVVLFMTISAALRGTLFGPDPVLSVRLDDSSQTA